MDIHMMMEGAIVSHGSVPLHLQLVQGRWCPSDGGGTEVVNFGWVDIQEVVGPSGLEVISF
jgi:hypothetical protein